MRAKQSHKDLSGYTFVFLPRKNQCEYAKLLTDNHLRRDTHA